MTNSSKIKWVAILYQKEVLPTLPALHCIENVATFTVFMQLTGLSKIYMYMNTLQVQGCPKVPGIKSIRRLGSLAGGAGAMAPWFFSATGHNLDGMNNL